MPPLDRRSYETREGGRGASIYFRARRFPARELLERVPVRLWVGDAAHEVFDLSMNGVSFFALAASSLQVGGRFPMRLTLAESTVYSGEGEVVRSDPHQRGQLVAARLTVGFLDIPRLVQTHDQVVLAKDLARGARTDLDLVPARYRQVCSEAVFLLRRYRSMSERYDEQLRATGSMDRRGRYQTMLDDCWNRLFPEWDGVRREANEILRTFEGDAERLAASKRFTEVLVTPELLHGPAWRRSYEKPLGYPGDFVIMNYFYAQAWEGDTAFAKLAHRLLITDPLPACVTPRMEMLRDAIERTVERAGQERHTVCIASLGAGPAREIEEYLKHARPARPVRFILIDQDERALSHAHSQIYPLAMQRGGNVSVECLYLSFSQLIREASLLDSLPSLDLAYAAGLLDYLRQPIAKGILQALFQRLIPSGLLVVGNMRARDDVGWTNELLLDWPLIFRSRQDMADLAADLDASVEVREERTGFTYLLYATKRP